MISARLRQRVVTMTRRQQPSNATHWSTRTMAAAVGISEASVRRIAKCPKDTGLFRVSLVVVVLIPIAVFVPAVLVFIPPLMPLTPATFSRIVQFTALMTCLFAVASMFLNRLVEFMFRVSDSALTSVEVFCVESWHCREKQDCRQYGCCEHRR
jgi:hypothetical protein